MSIAGVTNCTVLATPPQRRDSVAGGGSRTQDAQREAVSASNPGASVRSDNVDSGAPSAVNQYDNGRRDSARLRTTDSTQLVESGRRSSPVDFYRQADTQNLSLTAQKALKTFAENAPSPQQRLGIELAGIDTFA